MSSTVTSSSAARRTECVWALVILVFTAWFYAWTATSSVKPFTGELQKNDLYNRLADGFLAGQLSFLQLPNPALAQLADPWDPAQNGPLADFHDVTYYQGKYYLYFGPAPVLLLLAPWKAVTGSHLSISVATAIFSWCGVAASVALVLVLRRRYFPSSPGWITGLGLVAVAFGNFVPVLLRRPVAYELAIAAAYACAMVALLALACALAGGPRRRWWLVLAGLAYGFAVASRPNYIFGAVVLAAPLLPAWRAWRGRTALDRAAAVRDALAVGVPLMGIVAGLLLYNQLRFGRYTEFGTSYMLSGLHPQRDVVTSFRFVPANLWFYLFSRAQFSVFFPFVQVIHMPWFDFPAQYTGEEDVYGVLFNLPFFWMLFFLRGLWRDPLTPVALRDYLGVILAFVALNTLVICRVGGAANRYMVDLLPALLPLACVGLFWAEQAVTGLWRRAGLRALWLAALAVTVFINVFASLQHNELLRIQNPALYGQIAHAFNHVSGWLGQTTPAKTGPLRIRFVLPTERTGKLEPLVVTGLSFRADFLYIFYTDEQHIQIGFEHTSYGGPMTKPPIEIDYAVEHTLDVEMGSLYPPVEHPYYDGMAADEIAHRKRTLHVMLDGHEILAGDFEFYDSSPGDVSVGSNPVSEAFGRRFTGRVISVERVRGK